VLEPFLCLGGVEVANPARTLSYLKNLGHPYLRTVPNPGCKDCYPNERPVQFCEVPYAVTAGFDKSVTDQLATAIWSVFRGAEPLTRVGVHRQIALTGCPAERPPVPLGGWVTSEYVDTFELPLVLSTDSLADCTTSECRFERWMVYDLDRWPVPHQSAPAPGEADGTLEVLFYIDPCSATGVGFGQCGVSFDDGLTWKDLTTTSTPGQVSGQVSGQASMRIDCITTDPAQFTFQTTADATGFCHRFDYAAGGSGYFDVQVWVAPALDQAAPPIEPFGPNPTAWLLAGLGTVDDGVMGHGYDEALCGTWATVTPWVHKFWRFTDRVTRAVYEVAISLDDDIDEATSTWAGLASYSLNGGTTWHTPPDTGTVLLTVPVPVLDAVPTVSGTELSQAPFTTPTEDNAPWYDPNEPDSADVLGVWIEEFLTPVPWSREVRERSWGGSLPRGKLTSREIQLTGFVWTRSCEATEYAKRWLFEALAQESCAACDLPDALVYRGCNPDTFSAEYARTLRRVGLVSYNPELESEYPCCLGFKWEATLRAEVPYLYREPVTVYDGPVMDPESPPICNVCNPCPQTDAEPLGCGCMGTSVPTVVTSALNECYCNPVEVRRLCVPIDSAGFTWSDATVRLTVNVGGGDTFIGSNGEPVVVAEAIRNLRIAAYPNPLDLDTPVVDGTNYFECQDPCIEVEVACLPPNGQLVVDGTTRRSTVSVGPRSVDGYGHLSSGGGGRFQWPDVGCNGLMLCIDTDAVFTSPDTRIKVELVRRERA
jgi:hypothetical protein